MFIVELEKGVWLAPWEGDPGRTLVKESAKKFNTYWQGVKALSDAKDIRYRDFNNAKVQSL